MENNINEPQSLLLEHELVVKLSSFFKVIGDETRVNIIYALSKKEMCVGEISQILNIS